MNEIHNTLKVLTKDSTINSKYWICCDGYWYPFDIKVTLIDAMIFLTDKGVQFSFTTKG